MVKKVLSQDQKDQQEGDKKRRQLERRDTPTQVDRDITSRFASLSAIDIDVRKNKDNMTLREAITFHKRKAKEEGRKLSSAFWKKLTEEWAAESSPASQLQVVDKTQAVDVRLIQVRIGIMEHLCR